VVVKANNAIAATARTKAIFCLRCCIFPFFFQRMRLTLLESVQVSVEKVRSQLLDYSPKKGALIGITRVSAYLRISCVGFYAAGGARGEVWFDTGSNDALDPRTAAARLNWMG
jgi:hypothetical protein